MLDDLRGTAATATVGTRPHDERKVNLFSAERSRERETDRQTGKCRERGDRGAGGDRAMERHHAGNATLRYEITIREQEQERREAKRLRSIFRVLKHAPRQLPGCL